MASSQPSDQIRGGEKMQDSRRVQKLLDDIKDSSRPDQKVQGRQPIIMEEKAKEMLMEYSIELASSIIESANAMAKHRGSQTIEPDDVNLILAKKLGIELPGQSRIRSLHQHNLKSLYTPTVAPSTTSTATSKAIAASVVEARKGSKRKLNN